MPRDKRYWELDLQKYTKAPFLQDWMNLGSRRVFRVTIICDRCKKLERLEAKTEEGLEALIKAHGWLRFGPSGQDLCFSCTGASPNTVISVLTPDADSR